MWRSDHEWPFRAALTSMLLAAASLGACGGDSGSNGSNSLQPPGSTSLPLAVNRAAADGTAVDPAIVAADNLFGIELLNTLLQENARNTAISPLSVSLALQVTYNGAAGATQQAMAQTLHLGALSTQQLNDANAALQASLVDTDPQVALTIANSLWLHEGGNSVVPAFTAMDKEYYGATVGDLSGAPDNVNAWVASETQGLIKGILPPGDYSIRDAVALLANVIYFKGAWATPFDPGLTADATFTLSDGTQVTAPMMHGTGNYPYLRGTHFQALRLPYGQGRLSMLIVLPDADTPVQALLAGVSAPTVDSWVSQAETLYGDVALPRFTATFSASLNSALTTLGMGIAFRPTAADFSGLAPGADISGVVHATRVQVDETGTTAAGVTGVTIGITAVPSPHFTMTMDRPFFYAIRDDETGALLFVGVLLDPS